MIPLRAFGPSKVMVPALGLGTWNMEGDDRGQAVAALVRGIELGMHHLDTAELYGRGKVESMVADVLVGRRAQVHLVSKVLPTNASKKGVVAACEASLRRLGTDYLDTYLLHWPGSHPLEETVAGFEALRESGKIRGWGVSNFDVTDLEAVEKLAPGRMSCNQVLYHLGERAIEHAVLPWCEKRSVAVTAYSPFGSGNFPGPQSPGGLVLEQVAQKHGATPRQVALAFLGRRPSVFVIPKSARVQGVEENARSAAVHLDPQDVELLEVAFPLGKRRSLPTI